MKSGTKNAEVLGFSAKQTTLSVGLQPMDFSKHFSKMPDERPGWQDCIAGADCLGERNAVAVLSQLWGSSVCAEFKPR